MSADDLAHFPTVTLELAEQLLTAFEAVVERLEKAENAVRRQEAELATGVSVVRNPNEQQELADRFESILAGVCGIDRRFGRSRLSARRDNVESEDATAWGLPVSKLADPPRPLRGALADLESLLGNAVLLEDIQAMPEWPSPEDYASAVVVPIGSSTMPHGTIWFWSDRPRKHTATEVEVANMAAERIMSELEKSLLGDEAKQAKRLRKELDAAGQAQAARLPDDQPLHRDFQTAGWTFQDCSLGGGFHDWDMTPNGLITLGVGSASGSGPQGALVATTVQSTIRALWPMSATPSQILAKSSDVLWGCDEADWSASAALFQINPETGYGSVATAGKVQAFIVSSRGFRPLGNPSPRLASRPDSVYSCQRFVLQPGEALIAFSDTVVQMPAAYDRSNQRERRSVAKMLDQNGLLQAVRQSIDADAAEIAAHLARLLPSISPHSQGYDRSLVVLKNIRKK